MAKTEIRTGFWATVTTFAVSDALILWRMRTPVAFMFILPGLLAITLGPAISGAGEQATSGRSVVGVAVMFSFMTVNYVGLALFREHTHNTWMRQAIIHPPRLAFILGKSLPVAGAAFLQLGIFGAIAEIGYGLPLSGSLLQLIMVALLLVAFGCAFGVVLFVATKSVQSFRSLAYILLLMGGSAGGALVPTQNLPSISRVIGTITPQYWAMRAIDAAIGGTDSWRPALQAVLVIGGLTVAFAVVGVFSLRYRDEKSELI
ncbi:ABC transporter permease [Streptomyces sp. NPDC050121]|uniref:ABC transporter permease n=1 Tax=Streptomyces sp. NPDC050121 TaxID=3365601 RepID=UPI0037B2CE08